LWSSLRNTKGENVFGRQLEENALKRATSVVSVNLILMITATLIICATNAALRFSDVLFETASAIGTVGLSIGITNTYNILSRLIITFLMYCGRVGSLTFALIFTEHRVPSAVQKPTEKINIG
jgi:trk system potassium uptake protein TrkH